MTKERIGDAITTVRWDGSIALPYWLFKKGGLLHGRRQVAFQVREDGSLAVEPVAVIWVKAPRKPVKVLIHTSEEGTLWAEVPGMRFEARSIAEIKDQVRTAITRA